MYSITGFVILFRKGDGDNDHALFHSVLKNNKGIDLGFRKKESDRGFQVGKKWPEKTEVEANRVHEKIGSSRIRHHGKQ